MLLLGKVFRRRGIECPDTVPVRDSLAAATELLDPLRDGRLGDRPDQHEDVGVVDGTMVDQPVILRAQRIVARA